MLNFLKKLMGGETADLTAIKAKGAVIIDVRTPAEYKSGHGKGSINIPLNTIGANIDKIKKYNKPVICCCKSGMRSGSATGLLKKEGIEAYNAGTWQSASQL